MKKGPEVVHFIPGAFTPGCPLETKLFADAGKFSATGATLIGVTCGNTGRLAEFSATACRNRFPIAAVSRDTVKAYKVTMSFTHWSNCTSYVIAPDGCIALSYSALKPNEHVARTLEAVKALKPEALVK